VISPPPAPIPPTVTAPPPTALAAKPIAPRRPPPDFDATATDIPDVSSFDFPVLMDAVEDIAPRAPVVRAPLAPPAPRAPIPPAARPTGAAPPPPRRLLEPKSAAPSAAPPPPAPAVQVEEDPDALRQTQAVRAISQAKSIDDVSDSMAETLFGDAELDFLSATLASAIGEGEEPRAGAPATSAAPTPPPAPPPEELMDLFNLGPDAPLELIDDSAAPQTDRRKTVRR